MPAPQCRKRTSARRQLEDQKTLAARQPTKSPQLNSSKPTRSRRAAEGQWLGATQNLSSRAKSGSTAHISQEVAATVTCLLQGRDRVHLIGHLTRVAFGMLEPNAPPT